MTEQRRGVRPPVIDRQLAKELDQYRGRYVAIDDGHVIASGESPTDVLAEARERGYPDPLLHRVPSHPERPRLFSAQSDAVV